MPHGNFVLNIMANLLHGPWQILFLIPWQHYFMCHGIFTKESFFKFIFISQTWKTYFMDHGKLNLCTSHVKLSSSNMANFNFLYHGRINLNKWQFPYTKHENYNKYTVQTFYMQLP